MIFEERYPKVAGIFMLMQKRILCYMLKYRNQEHTRTTRKWINVECERAGVHERSVRGGIKTRGS